MRNSMETLLLAYASDCMLEIHLDALDFYVDGRKGRFPGPRVRDFIIQVARHWPNTATHGQLEAAPSIGVAANLPKLAHTAKQALAAAGMRLELLASRRNEGYRLTEGWMVVNAVANSRQLAESFLGQLRTALDEAKQHVARAQLETNAVGLMYVVRTQTARNLASRNYTLIEDAGWQLIYLLSEPDADLLRGKRLFELKLKIEDLGSYVLLWRMGDGNNMTARNWRDDFSNESEALFRDICRIVDGLLEPSSASPLAAR